jgi:histone H3/H4
MSYAARAMELFLKKLVEGTCDVAQSRNAKTVSTSHL